MAFQNLRVGGKLYILHKDNNNSAICGGYCHKGW